jgi:hypothetical protein
VFGWAWEAVLARCGGWGWRRRGVAFGLVVAVICGRLPWVLGAAADMLSVSRKMGKTIPQARVSPEPIAVPLLVSCLYHRRFLPWGCPQCSATQQLAM